MTITTPTLHMNGSGIANLRGELEAAHAAGRAFLNALARMTPHARDYYVTPGSYYTALEAHRARMQAVYQILDDIMTIWDEVEKQT